MRTCSVVEMELTVHGLAFAVQIRIGAAGERFVASVRAGSATTTGLGGTAREALVAALSPLGARTATAVMAAPDMFGASAMLRVSGTA